MADGSKIPAVRFYRYTKDGLNIRGDFGVTGNKRVWLRNILGTQPLESFVPEEVDWGWAAFDYIQFFDRDGRPRLSTFVWNGYANYIKSETHVVRLTLNIYCPLFNVTADGEQNLGLDKTRNFYGEFTVELPAVGSPFHADGSLMVSSIVVGNGNVTFFKKGKIPTVSLKGVTQDDWSLTGAIITGTLLKPALPSDDYAILSRLFARVPGFPYIKFKDVGDTLDDYRDARAIALRPVGVKSEGAEGVLAFGATVAVTSATEGKPALVRLVLDPELVSAHKGNPLIELTKELRISFITDGNNQKIGAQGKLLGDQYRYLLVERVPATAFVAIWNERIAKPYLASLRTVDDAQDLSLVPLFENPKGGEFDILFDLVQPTPLPNDDPKERDNSWHQPVAIAIRAAKDTMFTADAVFPGLLTHKGEQVRRRVTVEKFEDSFEWFNELFAEGADKPEIQFTITAVSKSPGTGGPVRVGALDLEFPPAAEEELPGQAPAGQLSIQFNVTFSVSNPTAAHYASVERDPKNKPGRARLPRQGEAIPRVVTQIDRLDLTDIRPGSQDPVPDAARAFDAVLGASELGHAKLDEETLEKRTKRETRIKLNLTRDAAIVVVDALPAAPPQNAKPLKTPFFLRGEEVTQANRNRRLSLTLHQGTPGTSDDSEPSIRTIVIDPEPVTVALVQVPSFRLDAETLAETDGELANWEISELEGNRWEIARIQDGFDLFFPPQGTGEEAEKGKPWPQAPDGQTFDFRLSALARLTLRSSYFKQRYAEAPWNLRRVLGYPGQRAPGAALSTARFEFLYGLGARFSGANLRLAEMSSRVGAVRDPLPARPFGIARNSDAPQLRVEAEVYDLFREFSASFTKVYGTRIGLFETYREGSDETGLSLEDKVAFALRLNEADLDSRPWDPKGSVAFDNQGKLRGGATWGFESKNLYDEVISDPESTQGQILNPAFSALGGSGFIRAHFAGGKSRIVSDTSFGRTHTYAIERIGRINVFWNIAKHVILYERTVLPSDQFQEEQKDQHLGRPVLRKVKEYVDLIEPDREYPEKGTALKSRGFVEACRFRTRRIPVNGRWGHDVPEGWMVPLWRADADPDIYPKPDIRLQLTAASSDAAASVQARFKDPSQLFFFTSTRQEDKNLPNPNLWAACPGIDLVNAPRPAPSGQPIIDANEPDGKAPDDHMRESLTGRITFDLDTEDHAVNLISGRTTAEPIGAVLETVTMMRGASTHADGGAPGQALALRQELEGIISDAKRLETVLDNALNMARSILQRFIGLTNPGSLKAEIHGELEKLRVAQRYVRAEVATARKAISDAAVRAKDSAKGLGDNWTDKAAAVKENVISLLATALDKRLTSIEDTITDIEHNIGAWAVEKVAGEWSAADDGIAMGRRLDRAFATISLTVDSGIGTADELLRRANEGAEELRDRLTGLQAGLSKVKDDLLKEIDAIASTATDFKKAFVSRIEIFSQQADGAIGQIEAAVQKLPRRLKSDTDSLRNALGQARGEVVEARDKAVSYITNADTKFDASKTEAVAAIAELYRAVTAALASARALSEKLAGLIAEAAAPAQGFVKRVADSFKAAMEKLHEACAKAVDTETFIKAVNAELTQLRADIATLRTEQIGPVVGELSIRAAEIADQFNDEIDHAQAGIVTAISGAEAWANATVASIESILVAAIDETVERLEDLADNGTDQLAAAADKLKDAAAQIAKDAKGAIPGSLTDSARLLEEGYNRLAKAPTFQNPNETLALIRAAGSSPILPNLKFNRDRIAYFFDDLRDSVKTSPAVALMNRAGEDLCALGIRVPTGELLDRLIPADLQNFDFAKLFPDLGGLKLDGLFKNLRLPSSLNDNVKVTHGFDKASLTGWAKAEAKSNFPERSDIFAFGPLKLALIKAKFNALADLALAADGHTKRSTKAHIVGDWELAFGGQPLVTLEETRIQFEDGKGLDVDIDPSRIRFDRAIQFLSDLIKSYGDPNSGFFLEMLEEQGVPSGIAARLSLPLPPLSFGAFSVWGLSFSSSFELHLIKRPGGKGADFAIGTTLALGRKSEPFIMRVWILVGGGWLETRAKYFPATGQTVSTVSIGLTAGLGLDFAFGPCRGFVFAMFGAYVEFSSGNGTHLTVAVIFLVRGGIVILGRFNIGLSLLLEIVYKDDGSVIGNGTIEVTLKICWCLKITVRQSVTYHLVNGGGSSSSAVAFAGGAPKRQYLDSFA